MFSLSGKSWPDGSWPPCKLGIKVLSVTGCLLWQTGVLCKSVAMKTNFVSDWKSNSTAAYGQLRRGQLGALFIIIIASLTYG
ncbi:hypothetical protein CSPX01_16027 [Colletotrichum filicis]|nr:hypothetical protein CSPX01_16027 [Colletotrichum filicis]